jgi:hypothetical protein
MNIFGWLQIGPLKPAYPCGSREARLPSAAILLTEKLHGEVSLPESQVATLDLATRHQIPGDTIMRHNWYGFPVGWARVYSYSLASAFQSRTVRADEPR